MLAAILGVSAFLSAASPAAGDGTPSPAWSISLTSYPTVFAPGSVAAGKGPPGFLLTATNIGAAATSGGFSLTVNLPEGIEPTLASGATGTYGRPPTDLQCGASGTAVVCKSGAPSLKPGQVAAVVIPVKVSSTAPSSVMTTASVEGGTAAASSASLETEVRPGAPPFSLLAPASQPGDLATAADGAAVTQAGSHPFEVRFGFGFPTQFSAESLKAVGGGVRDLAVDLPRGLVANPFATATRCTENQLETPGVGCPDSSQIGALKLEFSLGEAPAPSLLPLYNMVPPGGTAVEFGAKVIEGLVIHMSGGLRSDGDLGLYASVEDIPAKLPVSGAEVTLWGDPSDAAHDHVRGRCAVSGGLCPTEPTGRPFLTMPTGCVEALSTISRADSWLDPGTVASRIATVPALDGCNRLGFSPNFEAQPTSPLAGAPTGIELAVRMPQAIDGNGLSEAALRDATLVLPAGLVLSPAAADGLAACSPGQIGLTTSPGQQPVRFSAASPTCPDAAKIGVAEAHTPLIDHPLSGSVYVAEQGRNPFGTPFAIYLVLDDPGSGVVVKLAGRVEADPGSGRLTASFAELPQLPIEELKATFFDGPRAVLRTPPSCGRYEARAKLGPWSSPEALDANRSDDFGLDAAPQGPCSGSEAALPSVAELEAGSATPKAGAYSPFLLRVSRPDGSQRLAGVDLLLPAGVSARLAGVERCPAAAIGAVACPPASAVGRVDMVAGSGPSPLRLGGTAYLAGPYRGAPFSLAAVVPAVAGPFDLGSVVVRVALYVDPSTAAVHAVSDPFPAVVGGVPVDLRSLRVSLDRRGFARTPTSCDPTSVSGSALSPSGPISLTQRYQVGECSRLSFKPRASARLLGPTHRGAHPGLRVVIAQPRHGAALRRAGFTLPATQLLDSRHIRGICAAAEFASRDCGTSSRYGRLKVWSPLLEKPLSGPVFLRTGTGRLPDLAASLRGAVDLNLVGRLDTEYGRLRGTFRALPDVPLSRAVLTMQGGRRGLFVNTGGFCARTPRVEFSLLAQNAASRQLDPRLRGKCRGD